MSRGAAAARGAEEIGLELQGRVRGRAVLAERDGTLYLGRNYEIHRSEDGGRSFARVATMPIDVGRRLAGASRLLSRLGDERRERDARRLPRGDANPNAKREDRIEHRTGGPTERRALVQRCGMAYRATTANEPRAISFERDISDELWPHGGDVREPTARFPTRTRTP